MTGRSIRNVIAIASFTAFSAGCATGAQVDEPQDNARPRIRDLGVSVGILPTGELNAITDVAGVRVGHVTLMRGDDIRTGVTAVVPHGGDVFMEKVPAGVFVGNGFGKAAGFLQVMELGVIETPIVLTNTLSVGRVVEATVRWTLDQPGHERLTSVNAVVGETNDGYLNDIRGMHVSSDDVVAAIEAATGGEIAEGSVGAGTGTRALGFKGGIGTASRELPDNLGGYTVGVLVQTNFGGVLTIDGVRVGEAMGRHSFKRQLDEAKKQATIDSSIEEQSDEDEGSCMVVVATDAPLSDRNLQRLAKRAVLGLARAGGSMSNGSGDFVIAFSTAYTVPYAPNDRVMSVDLLDNSGMSPLFLAAVEATEEAVYNSLVRATTVTGRDGHMSEAISIEKLQELFEARGAGG